MDIEATILKIIEKTNLSREEIKKKIDESIEDMGGLIDEEGALILVAKNLGVDTKDQQSSSSLETEIKISDIKPRMYVSVIGRIKSIGEKKKFNRKDGSEGNLLPFVVKDKSGMARCVAWDHNSNIDQEQGFLKGELVRIVNGFVKEGYYGGLEIHIGNKSRIQIDPDNVDATLVPEKNVEKIEITPLEKISLNYPIVNIESKIAYMSPISEFTNSKTGKTGKRASIGVSEGESFVYINFWNEDVEIIQNIKMNQVVSITELKPKPNYKDKSKIDLTASSSTIIKMIQDSEDQDITPGTMDQTLLKISALSERESFGTIIAKVMDVEEVRTVNLKSGDEKKIQSLIIADETGSIKLTLWEEQIEGNFQSGEGIKIEGIYSRLNSYSNQMEANVSRKGNIEKIEEEIEVTKDIKKLETPSAPNKNLPKERKNLSEIQSEDYFSFKATLIKEISRVYLYKACEKCGRKSENCNCNEIHPEKNRMILNLTLDDGISTIRGTMFGDLGEKFLVTSADNVENFQLNSTFEDFLDKKNRELLGHEFVFQGKGKFSDYSGNYEVNLVSFEPINIIDESENILKIIESEN